MKLDDKQISDFLESNDKINEYDPILKSLWYDGNGNWEKAHDEVVWVDKMPRESMLICTERKAINGMLITGTEELEKVSLISR